MTPVDLFDGFDANTVASIEQNLRAQQQATGQATAMRRTSRIQTRRAKAEARLAEILPARFTEGDSWHVLSHGDIDALSYLRHALAGVTHFDHVLMSTWCIARADIEEIASWLDAGRIDQFDLYVGEIFPVQYGDAYELMLAMSDTYGCKLVIFKNHSKVTLLHHAADDYRLVVESSANVNTNHRVEQAAIHCSRELHAFYAQFFHGIQSIDKHSARQAR